MGGKEPRRKRKGWRGEEVLTARKTLSFDLDFPEIGFRLESPPKAMRGDDFGLSPSGPPL